MRFSVWIAVLALAAILQATVTAADDPLESNRQALALVRSSLAAFGGEQVLSNLKIAFSVRGEIISEGQSVAVTAPFETYPLTYEVKMDMPAKKIYTLTDSSISGDFRFTEITFLENGKGYGRDPVSQRYWETDSEPWVLDRILPFRWLQKALENPASLRRQTTSEAERTSEAVSYANANGQITTVYVDRETKQVLKIEQVLSFGPYGDGWRELEYSGYRKVAGTSLPHRLTIRNHNFVHGEVVNRFNYEDISTDVSFDSSQTQVPKDYVKADYTYRKDFNVVELGKNVYLIENVTGTTDQWSYNVLFVRFKDFVLVAEAPVSSAVSEKVLQKIRETFPGVPVRYLIQSHHHSDHLAGIRTYVAEGTTIVTTPGVVSLIELIAAAPNQLSPDRLQTQPRQALFETVVGKKIIRDSDQEVIVYDIGPNPHAREMLIVHIPSAGVLYQCDMINMNEYPENASTRAFRSKMKDLGIDLDKTTVAGLHGKVVGK